MASAVIAVRLPQLTLYLPLQVYLDSRDAGYVVLTHTYLLLGCALPVWLHTSAADVMSDGRCASALPGLAGILMLGIGDAAVNSLWRSSCSFCMFRLR